MSGTLSPRSAGRIPAGPFLVLFLVWGAVGVAGLVWVAGRLAALVTGRGWDTGPGFGTEFAAALVRGQWERLWPGVPAPLVAVFAGVLLALVVAVAGGGWWLWVGRRPRADDPLPALASPADVATLLPAGALGRARRLRPSLSATPDKAVRPAEVGVLLGALVLVRSRVGPALRASWEDVLLAIMAPRAGKTTALAVNAVLDAPGVVIATSNKADLWAATAPLRAAQGQMWTFDPQTITHGRQEWWWNPLAAVTSVEEANRLAGHFIQEIQGKDSRRDFWAPAARRLLTALLLAAACSGGSLWDVQRWLSDTGAREPSRVLKDHGYLQSAIALEGTQAGAPDTREGVYETARTAAACLENPAIMAWVTPPSGRHLAQFPVTAFVAANTGTLHLLSKDGAGAAAPLVGALVDQVLRAAVQHAETRGGRLDPPMMAVLDEAANICKIDDLPELYSHFGSRGIVPLTILQSYRQGVGVWGETGMDTLWGASTVKLIGAGMDDDRFAESISRLVGDHDVAVSSFSRGHDGRVSESVGLRRQRVLGPEAVRALPMGTALVMATGARVAMAKLLPWYAGERAAEISAAVRTSTEAITRGANLPGQPIDRAAKGETG